MRLRGRKVLVFLHRGDPPSVLLLRRVGGRATGEWHPVTGHVEPGESLEAAALREAREETGLTGTPEALGVTHAFSVPDGPWAGTYEEHAFGLRVAAGEPRLSEEHDAHAWVPLAEARDRLGWQTQQDALSALEKRISRAS